MAIVRMSNVKFDRWVDFEFAVNRMIDQGIYRDLVDIHGDRVREPDGFVRAKHRMHGSMYGPIGYRRFLPWHRAYLIAFERELRKMDKDLSIPYWDWDNDKGRLKGFSGYLAMSTGRNLGLNPDGTRNDDTNNTEKWFSSHELTESLETFGGDYYIFTSNLERGQHNGGHDWIGGDMADTQFSPRDIAFWLHHAAVDRVWAKWQTLNPGERAHLNTIESRLDPWDDEFTILNIDNIENLGNDSYSYQDPDRPDM